MARPGPEICQPEQDTLGGRHKVVPAPYSLESKTRILNQTVELAISTLWIPTAAWARRAGMNSYLPRSARVEGTVLE